MYPNCCGFARAAWAFWFDTGVAGSAPCSGWLIQYNTGHTTVNWCQSGVQVPPYPDFWEAIPYTAGQQFDPNRGPLDHSNRPGWPDSSGDWAIDKTAKYFCNSWILAALMTQAGFFRPPSKTCADYAPGDPCVSDAATMAWFFTAQAKESGKEHGQGNWDCCCLPGDQHSHTEFKDMPTGKIPPCLQCAMPG
jgi:hypothetical protein